MATSVRAPHTSLPAPPPPPRAPHASHSATYAYIKRAGAAAFAEEAFAEIELRAGDTAARVAARACKEFPLWGVDAGQVRLFQVPGGRDEARSIQRDPSSETAILRGEALFADEPVESGSWLLARLPPPGASEATPRLTLLSPQELFFAALPAAWHDAEARSLTLPAGAGAEWGGAAGSGRTLFVRECYDTLDAAAAVNRFALVRGTPGIGKSMFALYHVWRALQRGGVDAVVYDCAFGAASVLRIILEKGVARNVEPRPIERLLYAASTLYVADGTPPSLSSCRTVVVTSPKRDVWKEWAKGLDVADFFVPPFAADEMERCRALCFPALDAAAVARSFDVWGGSARLVLRHHEKASALHFQREVALSLTFDALRSVVHDLAAGGSASADTPQRVVHMFPAEDLCSFELRFASRHMLDVFYGLLQHTSAERVRGFVAAAESSPAMAPLRGQLFERLALAALCCRGEALPLFALGDSVRSALAGEPLVDRGVHFFRSVEEAAAAVRACQLAGETPPLCRPRAANFATWDAAAIDAKGRLTLYQATVSAAHDVKLRGLSLAEPLAALSTGTVRLVFVVPPRCGPQRAAPLPKRLPRWLIERGLEQLVLVVSLTAEPDAVARAVAGV